MSTNESKSYGTIINCPKCTTSVTVNRDGEARCKACGHWDIVDTPHALDAGIPARLISTPAGTEIGGGVEPVRT
jgi:DNA-directed RNA polymerase subunit RPC12/RpoP